jgi:putative endonuclease
MDITTRFGRVIVGSSPAGSAMQFSVYILRSLRTARTYVGYSSDPIQRLKNHNNGKVGATKIYLPWEIIYTESNLSKSQAKKRELYWKSAAGRRNMKRIMTGFPPHFRIR